jgi:2,4-dienoyl-CoA reductase-like NADH-dependent reductase (Old Yellow Enzyme family)
MWKPPERIRHPLPEPAWPTAEAAAAARWFQPVDLGPLRLAERTWVPAMVPWRATEEGFVTPEVLAWYERFARGEPGAIVVEATGIRDVPSGPLLRVGDDRFLPGLGELVSTVRRASGGKTKLFLQIIDFLSIRRRPERSIFLSRFLKISDALKEKLSVKGDVEARGLLLTLTDSELREVLSVREWHDLQFGARELVTDLHVPSVRSLPEALPPLFASAALRAERAGFDGVELHFAHAYTMASFLSPLNTRDDGYGGPRENRVRLPLEVLAAVRSAVGSQFAVGCRFLAEERIGAEGGGGTVEDASFFATEFARGGVDFLSLSRGGKFEDAKQPKVGWSAYPYTGPSGYECMPTAISDAFGPFGRNVAAVAAIRAAVRGAGFSTPVVLAGGISGFAQAEALLASGAADIVAAARQSLADPDWFRKIRLGRGAEVRRCIFSNYCEGLDQMHKQVTCQLWDREDLEEPGILKSRDGRRRRARGLRETAISGCAQ